MKLTVFDYIGIFFQIIYYVCRYGLKGAGIKIREESQKARNELREAIIKLKETVQLEIPNQ